MQQFILQHTWVIIVVIAWTLPWKGYALWKAAQNKHAWWFIALLIINTFALLEILYIFVISEKNRTKKIDFK